MNIVPTEQTKKIAALMLREVQSEAGSQVVLERLRHVRPDQLPALLAVVLDAKRANRKIKPLTLSREDRLRGYALWRRGDRTPFAVTAYREYQRAHKRGDRQWGKPRMEARIAIEEAAYSDDDARRARASYLAGSRTEWAVVGTRVYYRRAKRGQFAAENAEDAA